MRIEIYLWKMMSYNYSIVVMDGMRGREALFKKKGFVLARDCISCLERTAEAWILHPLLQE